MVGLTPGETPLTLEVIDFPLLAIFSERRALDELSVPFERIRADRFLAFVSSTIEDRSCSRTLARFSIMMVLLVD